MAKFPVVLSITHLKEFLPGWDLQDMPKDLLSFIQSFPLFLEDFPLCLLRLSAERLLRLSAERLLRLSAERLFLSAERLLRLWAERLRLIEDLFCFLADLSRSSLATLSFIFI